MVGYLDETILFICQVHSFGKTSLIPKDKYRSNSWYATFQPLTENHRRNLRSKDLCLLVSLKSFFVWNYWLLLNLPVSDRFVFAYNSADITDIPTSIFSQYKATLFLVWEISGHPRFKKCYVYVGIIISHCRYGNLPRIIFVKLVLKAELSNPFAFASI